MAAIPSAQAQSDDVVDSLDEAERPWAEGVPEDAQEGARAVFAEANRMMNDGLFAQAAAAYKETLAFWDHAGAHYNLGLAQLSLDQPIEAYESFGRAMRFGPAPLQGQARYEQAQRYREMLEQQLARVEIACREAEAAVTMDGKHLFTGPGRYEGMVRPGGHQIVASKPGRIPATELAVLSPGDHGRYDLVLAMPESVTTVRRWSVWKPWVVVGASAAVMLGAAYFDDQSSQGFDAFDHDFDMLCENGCAGMEVPKDLQDRLARAELEQRVGQALYAAGGAALITGVVLVYMNREQIVRRGGREHDGQAAQAHAPAFQLSVGQREAGVSINLRF